MGIDLVSERKCVATPIGEVIIDAVYLDHIHEVDPTTGRTRVNHDHVSFAPLVQSTLERPIEVYQQQEGGRRTRRTIFLGLYQIDSSYSYHMVIAARGGRVLTSYRLNGGTAAFRQVRFGVPLFVSY
jgi:hypothetical protein